MSKRDFILILDVSMGVALYHLVYSVVGVLFD